jgi:chromosome segregation ATPase
MSTTADVQMCDENVQLKKRVNELEERDRVREKEKAELKAQASKAIKEVSKLRKQVHRLEKMIARMRKFTRNGQHDKAGEMAQVVEERIAEVREMHEDQEKAIADVRKNVEEYKDKELAYGVEDMMLN